MTFKFQNLSRIPASRIMLRGMVGLFVALIVLIGPAYAANAAALSQRITVKQRLVVWASPSLGSQVRVILLRGRPFTLDGRNAAGTWLHGFSAAGVSGWVTARGLLMLHPGVNAPMLPILAMQPAMQSKMGGSRTQPTMSAPRSGY